MEISKGQKSGFSSQESGDKKQRTGEPQDLISDVKRVFIVLVLCLKRLSMSTFFFRDRNQGQRFTSDTSR